jgi:hypothetical protein
VAPATASASVHAAEVFTTGASGLAHWRLGNVRRALVSSGPRTSSAAPAPRFPPAPAAPAARARAKREVRLRASHSPPPAAPNVSPLSYDAALAKQPEVISFNRLVEGG